MRMFNRKAVFAAACVGLVGPSVFAVDFPEVEPNDTKITPNVVSPMAPGDTISGSTTGASTTVVGAASSDNFDVTTTAAPSAGIWRYRLTLTTGNTGVHTGTLRGRTQTAGVPNATTDSAVQTSAATTTPARTVQWYANETASRVIYRVTGVAATTLPYAATLVRDAVTPTIIPDTISAGPITFTSIGQTTADTELWLYDSNFNAIVDAGNDDESLAGGGTGATAQSRFTRILTPGTYTLAVGTWNMANHLGSPPDDDFRSGLVLEFPNSLAGVSAIATATTLNFSIIHSGGTAPVVASRSESYGILFYQFTVAATANPLLTACTATPSSTVVQGNAVTLSTNITWSGTPGTVTADLSAFGGNNAAPLTDNGGGNYSVLLNVPGAQAAGPYSVVLTGTNPLPGSEVGACSVNLTVVLPPPANDTCAGAIVASLGTTSDNNATATSIGDPVPSCQASSGKGLWYTFTAGALPQSITFDTNGSTQTNTVLTAFDACGGTELACDDNAGVGSLSSLTLNLAANQQLWLMVSSFGAAPVGGAFNLNIAETVPPPANDTCAGALVALIGTTTGDNTTATSTGDQAASCATTSGKGVFYTFTAGAAGTYTMDTEGSAQLDTVLSVYSACGGTQLACDDDGGTIPANSSRLTVALAATQTVIVQVKTFGSDPVGGGFNLNIAPPPCVSFLTQPTAQAGPEGGSATFTVVASTTGTPAFQWQTAPVTAGPYTDLVDGVAAGLGTVSGATTASVTISNLNQAASTTRFRVFVIGDCGNGTSIDVALTVTPPAPANDTCATAIAATLGTQSGNNANATSTGDPAASCQASTSKGVWFTFNAGAAGGTFLMDTENSAQSDTVLNVFDACGGTELACNDDSGVTPPLSARLTITLTANQNVVIQVKSFGAAAAGGGYTLNISNCTSISSQPVDATAPVAGTANFSVVAAGPGTLTFQWQRDPLGAGTFANVPNGIVAGLGIVSGATTADLSISGLEAAASTDKFRVVISGSCTAINSAAATLTVGSAFPARCNGADIAYDNGDFLPRAEIVDGTNGTPAIPGPFGGVNNGVTEADYNVFFANFFDANAVADIANDDGVSRVPTPAPGTVVNNGVTEGDYNYFFSVFFDGCSL